MSLKENINGMALIRTLTVSTTAFERRKEKFYDFRQTVLGYVSDRMFANLSIIELIQNSSKFYEF